MATKAFLEQAYLAYFGRPIDPNGVAAFVNSTETEVENAFWASPESQALYGSVMGLQQINMVYNMLFGRDAEPAGLAYWANQIVIGALTPAGAAIGILRGALNDDVTVVNNKLAASAAFTAGLDTTPEILGFAGDAAAAVAREWLATVTMTPATQAEVDAAIVAAVAVGSNTGGQTLTLTWAQDVVVGGAGNDIIKGVLDASPYGGTSSDNTLQSFDTINGGEGNDTLVVTALNSYYYGEDNTVHLQMANVEKMIVRDYSDYSYSTTTMFMNSVTDLNTVSLEASTGEDTLYLYEGTSVVPNLEFHNVNAGIYQDAGVVSVIDQLSVIVDNSDAWLNVYSTSNDRANYKALAVNSIGKQGVDGDGWNYLWAGENEAMAAITVTGDTNIDLSIEHWNAVNTVDASALTAGLEMDLYFQGAAAVTGGTGDDYFYDYSADSALAISYTTGAGNDTVDLEGGGATNLYTADTGAGNDTIIMSTGKDTVTAGADDDTVVAGDNLAAGDLLDGGAGSDTLSMTSAAAIAATALTGAASTDFQALFSNFETLGLADFLVGAIDMAKLDGMNNLSLIFHGLASVAGLTSGATITDTGGAFDWLTANIAGTGTADTLNVNLKSANGIGESIAATGVETLNIVSTDTDTTAQISGFNYDMPDLKSITVSGNSGVNFSSSTGTKVTSFDASGVSGAAADADLVRVSFLSNNATATDTVNITGSSGNDYLIGNAAKDVINGGAGNDLIWSFGGNDTLNGGAGDDTLMGGAGLDILTGGAGKDIFEYFGAVTDSNGVNTDTVTDFVSGTDKIETAVLVTYVGGANGYGAVLTSLTGVAHQGVLDTSTSTLYIDVDGSATLDNADIVIQMTGVTALAQADFIHA